MTALDPVLARALAVGLGAVSVAVAEEPVLPCLHACFAAAGLIPAPLAKLHSGRNRCGFVGFPVDADEATEAAEQLLDMLQPKAVIAVERPGE